MANANTIKSQVVGTIQETLAPIVNVVASSTETAYAYNAGAVSGAGGGVSPLAIGNPGIYFGTGRGFKLRAFGFDVVGATSTLTLNLYQVPASVIAAGITGQQTFTGFNKIATSTARSVTTANGQSPFVVEATLQLGAGGRLTGTFSTEINNLYDAVAATTVATGLLGEQDLNFVLTATQSVGNALTTSTLAEFSIEAV